MRSHRRIILIITLATGLVFGGCKSKPTPDAPTASHPDSSGDVGKALVVYDYSKVQTSDWTIAVHVEIPVVIEKDPVAGDTSFRVIGDKAAAYDVTVQGPGGPTGECLKDCGFPRLYIIRGKMNLVVEQGDPNCIFSLKIYGDFGGKNVEPPGTCPIDVMDDFNCAKLCQASYDERTVSLDNNSKVITPDPESGAVVNYRVEIKDLELASDVGCRWDE